MDYYYLVDQKRRCQSLAHSTYKACADYKRLIDPCDQQRLDVGLSSVPNLQFGQQFRQE